MKRTFYLVAQVLRNMQAFGPSQLVNMIFDASDVKDHLTDKLSDSWHSLSDYSMMLENFYLKLDGPHQIMFDQWFNDQMEEIETKTIPHSIM